ncbi:MAG: hypothetical protein QOE62_1921 [Actinomycetota bacterium]|nr:hypothetical protein [Actinomycetota bacterium]
MMRGWRRAIPMGIALTGLFGSTIAVTATAAAASPKPSFTTVASGFDNPRGIAIGEDGHLYVAEAGRGGTKCVAGGGGGGNTCVGATGGVSVISEGGSHHQIVSGLLSVSDTGGVFATGPDGLSRTSDGALYTVMTSCPQQLSQLPAAAFDSSIAAAKAQAGQVIRVRRHGKFETTAGVGKFDWEWSKTHTSLVPGQFPDCNPYGILAGEHGQWVVDAATNTLDRVSSDGKVKIVAFFPNPPSSDAVPTCLDRGPDGALYIGELTGGGNKPGASIVWRVDTREEHPTPTMWASGLTAVTGCGFADGKFYATEFSTLGLDNAAPGTGAVVRVSAHSTSPTVVADGLSFPNGFAAHGNSIYVSNWSIAPAVIPAGAPPFVKPGEVVRIQTHGSDHDGDDD